VGDPALGAWNDGAPEGLDGADARTDPASSTMMAMRKAVPNPRTLGIRRLQRGLVVAI
jgi:hypothetical protein